MINQVFWVFLESIMPRQQKKKGDRFRQQNNKKRMRESRQLDSNDSKRFVIFSYFKRTCPFFHNILSMFSHVPKGFLTQLALHNTEITQTI